MRFKTFLYSNDNLYYFDIKIILRAFYELLKGILYTLNHYGKREKQRHRNNPHKKSWEILIKFEKKSALFSYTLARKLSEFPLKVAKVAKSAESCLLLRVVLLCQSRRVERKSLIRVDCVSLADILCAIVRVGVGIGCNHVFCLILITKVVFTEEDARDGIDFSVLHVIFP